MNTKKLLWIIFLVLMVVIIVLQLRNNKKVTLDKVYHYDKTAPISILVDTLELQKLNNKTSFTGIFNANKKTKLSADVPGKIISVFVDEGSKVKKGEPLLQQDKSSMELQLKQINVKIKGLEDDVRRYSALKKADAVQGVKLEKAQLGLQSVKIEKSILQDKIDKTTVRAPFDGIITMKFCEQGEYSAPGKPLFQLIDISTLKFNITVSENEVILFNDGDEFPITSNVFPEVVLTGKVTTVGAESNKMSHDFPVEFTIHNTKDLKIKSGMFGNVYVTRENDTEHIVIEASSIVGSNIHPQVYVVKDGKAWLHDIIISSRFKNKAVVSKGLSQGDVIVTTGFINLFDGANVIIKN